MSAGFQKYKEHVHIAERILNYMHQNYSNVKKNS